MDNYVARDLTSKLNKTRPGTFIPYMVGGCGWEYSEAEIEMMRQLHTKGWAIDTGIVDKRSNTALHIAHCHYNQYMIDFLLSFGADTNARNYRNQIPQDLAPIRMPGITET